ncbi:hypothetical protein BDN70DRAFT_871176 [Pholiota conissans]|uniref:Uncharacterized protein n=1 Tax=Pholiota conissans TaxID=109636 RepID=A0A9P5ZC57_9AGAR|nr:hypothetical protein BDN70DRAFT_871176 [Pholiota conissans]
MASKPTQPASKPEASPTNATIIVAPDRKTTSPPENRSVFLAGSIDQGVAEDWQSKVTTALKGLPITIYNPRRKDWDSTWKQEASNDQFYDQVTWELERLETVDVILMFLAPESQSPISLLEMGLFTKEPKRIVIGCPEGFYRRGNVQIVAQKYHLELVDSLDKLIEATKERLLKTDS